MGDTVVLSWTVANWITVLLMVFVGFLIVGLVAGGYQKVMSKKGGSDGSD